MKEKLKRVIVLFLVVGGSIAFSLNANANSSKITFFDAYLVFEIWQGSGDSSVTIGESALLEHQDIVKAEEFEELQYKGKAIDICNYTVTQSEHGTNIMLKEGYLKTLKDGSYIFDAVFSRAIIPVRLHIITHKVSLTDAYFTFFNLKDSGSMRVDLTPAIYSYTFYPELFNGLKYKGKIVDDSKYTISQFQNVTSIILKEEYVKTLPEGNHYFVADFMNVSVKLKLEKEVTKVKRPIKVKKIKVIAKKKRLVVKWKKQKNVTGYIIKIGTNKKITKNKKVLIIKKNKNTSTIKGLKRNRNYYIKIRAYKIVNGKKYCSSWSTRVLKKTK